MTIDAQILRALRLAGEGSVAGTELSDRLGISRAAIWARIEELRRLGYEIEATPHRGYRLLASPDLLHADDLMARLGPDCLIGREIHVFESTNSTNDVIEKMARDSAAEGVVVFAESQSRGRGRLGRKWHSPKGKGLWLSVLLRPDLQPLEITRITIAAATALRRAIQVETGLCPGIKWPNDILIRQRKTAGILIEMRAELDTVKHVVLGMGIDVNLEARELPEDLRGIATSLLIESRRRISRPGLATTLLRELDHDYTRLRRGDFSKIAEEWERHSTLLGQHVALHVGSRRISGRAEALDDDGALLIRTQHGRLERIIGGDVSLEK